MNANTARKADGHRPPLVQAQPPGTGRALMGIPHRLRGSQPPPRLHMHFENRTADSKFPDVWDFEDNYLGCRRRQKKKPPYRLKPARGYFCAVFIWNCTPFDSVASPVNSRSTGERWDLKLKLNEEPWAFL